MVNIFDVSNNEDISLFTEDYTIKLFFIKTIIIKQ